MAKLSHPNVISVYDVGTVSDRVFIVMEHVEGSTFGAWLSERARPWREVLSMFVQAGRGLAAAHAAGILHRDFKPDNVLVGKDGRARVMDFGLARAAQPLNGPDDIAPEVATTAGTGSPPDAVTLAAALTEPGKFLGTPAYMAPEQLMGQPATEKTDQFSFCVALYQGLYGELPYAGEIVGSVLSEMRQGRVSSPPKSNNIPARLRQIVLRGLSFNPGERHASMEALLDALAHQDLAPRRRSLLLGALLIFAALFFVGRTAWQGRAASRIKSLAVLPLENLTGDESQDFFVEGMTEELITNLAQISALRVISRSSVMQYQRTRKAAPEIAKELGVDAVVEGSVARSSDRIRVTAQLIEGRSDRHLWAKAYEREISDVLRLQREIARSIAAEVEIKLKPQEQAHLAAARSVGPDVYENYLMGRYFWNRRAFLKAIGYFEQAMQKDPGYAPAYAGLADCYHSLASPAYLLPWREASRRAKEFAVKALSLDDSLAEAHATLAYVMFKFDDNLSGAEKEFQRALELNPNYAPTHVWFSFYYSHLGRWNDAYEALQRGLQLDPLNAGAYRAAGNYFHAQKQYDKAIEAYEKANELSPDEFPNHYFLGNTYVAKQMYPEAVAEYLKGTELSGGNVVIRADLAGAYALWGKRAEAEETLRSVEADVHGPNAAWPMSRVWALLGRREEALSWLERAQVEGNPRAKAAKNDPVFDFVRSEPRFQAALKRMEQQ